MISSRLKQTLSSLMMLCKKQTYYFRKPEVVNWYERFDKKFLGWNISVVHCYESHLQPYLPWQCYLVDGFWNQDYLIRCYPSFKKCLQYSTLVLVLHIQGFIGYKVTLKGELSSSPTSPVVKASDYKSQGFEFEFLSGQGFFILYFFFCFPCVPRRSTEPIQMKSSMTFIRGKRCIDKSF